MDNRKVRIGIDVGGTFTDAVVVDNETYEVIAKEKVPTTHHAERGVAQGIIEAINTVLTKMEFLRIMLYLSHMEPHRQPMPC